MSYETKIVVEQSKTRDNRIKVMYLFGYVLTGATEGPNSTYTLVFSRDTKQPNYERLLAIETEVEQLNKMIVDKLDIYNGRELSKGVAPIYLSAIFLGLLAVGGVIAALFGILLLIFAFKEPINFAFAAICGGLSFIGLYSYNRINKKNKAKENESQLLIKDEQQRISELFEEAEKLVKKKK